VTIIETKNSILVFIYINILINQYITLKKNDVHVLNEVTFRLCDVVLLTKQVTHECMTLYIYFQK
jgi:hypothetical protein